MTTENKDYGAKKIRLKELKVRLFNLCLVIVFALFMLPTVNGKLLSIPNHILAISVCVFTLVIYFAFWYWYKKSDEFEKILVGQSACIAILIGIISFPWSLLNSLGYLPPVDHSILFTNMLSFSIIYHSIISYMHTR